MTLDTSAPRSSSTRSAEATGGGWALDGPAPDAQLGLDLFAATNVFRASKGVALLVPDPILQAIAEWKASNMAAFEYMAHDQADGAGAHGGTTIGARFDAFGWPYSRAWGENIEYGSRTGVETVEVFTSQGPGEGHYDNIVQPLFTACGMAAAVDKFGTVFWVQDFGSGAPAPPPPPPPPPTPDPTPVVPHIDETWRLKSRPKAALLLILAGTTTSVTHFRNQRTGMSGHERTAKFTDEHERVT